MLCTTGNHMIPAIIIGGILLHQSSIILLPSIVYNNNFKLKTVVFSCQS